MANKFYAIVAADWLEKRGINTFFLVIQRALFERAFDGATVGFSLTLSESYLRLIGLLRFAEQSLAYELLHVIDNSFVF